MMRDEGRVVRRVDKRHQCVCTVKDSGLHSLGPVTTHSLYLSERKDGVVRLAFYVNHSDNSVDQDHEEIIERHQMEDNENLSKEKSIKDGGS